MKIKLTFYTGLINANRKRID